MQSTYFFFLFLCVIQFSLAQTSEKKLQGHSLVIDTALSIDEVLVNERFKAEARPYVDFGYFKQKVWLKFPFKITKQQPYILDYYQHFIDSLRLHVVQGNQVIYQSDFTGLHQLKKNNLKHLGNLRGYEFPIEMNVGSYEAYVEIHSRFSPIRGQLTLWEKEAYKSRFKVPTQYKPFWNGVFGFVLFASFIALIFWGFTRELMYVLFAFYVVISVVNMYVTRGFTEEVFWLFPNLKYDIRAFFNASLAFITTLYFYYLVPEKYANRWVRKFMFWQLLISSIISVIIFLLPENLQLWHWFIRLMKPVFFSTIIVGVFHFSFAIRNGHQLSKIYLIAYSMMFVSIIFHLLQILGLFKGLNINLFIWESSVFLELLIFTFAFVYRYYNTQQEKIRLVEQINTDQKIYLEKYYLAQENERKNIAKNLHDGVVQQLVTLGFGIQSLQTDEKQVLKSVLDNAVGELRDLSHQLMPKSLTGLGLENAIEDLLKVSLQHTDLDYEYDHFGIEKRLPENIELNLYRCVQELVHNAIKYSQASKIEAQLYILGNELFLIVADNGVGMIQETHTGIGLKSIASRVDSVSGKIRIESEENKGTSITIKIPLN